ncbi:hypothetical protein NKH70_28955 [Mesorhizobium sp. M0991]
MTAVVAELCKYYRIKVTSKTVLSHAEVESNLGIEQRGKWDSPGCPSIRRSAAQAPVANGCAAT